MPSALFHAAETQLRLEMYGDLSGWLQELIRERLKSRAAAPLQEISPSTEEATPQQKQKPNSSS